MDERSFAAPRMTRLRYPPALRLHGSPAQPADARVYVLHLHRPRLRVQPQLVGAHRAGAAGVGEGGGAAGGAAGDDPVGAGVEVDAVGAQLRAVAGDEDVAGGADRAELEPGLLRVVGRGFLRRRRLFRLVLLYVELGGERVGVEAHHGLVLAVGLVAHDDRAPHRRAAGGLFVGQRFGPLERRDAVAAGEGGGPAAEVAFGLAVGVAARGGVGLLRLAVGRRVVALDQHLAGA